MNPISVEYALDTNTMEVALFAGNVISLVLYGALTVQLYLYYISFPPGRDPRLLKTVVYVIYVTETVYTILLTYDLGNSMLIGDSKWDISSVVIPIGGGMVALLTQAMYAYRIYVLSQFSRLKYVSWCIMAIIAAELVVIIVLAPLMAQPSVLVFAWVSISLAIDTTIASIMIWFLTKTEMRSKRLKSKVARLIHLMIGTGALTATINHATVILFAQGSPVAYGPSIVLSKVYANSMMVFLNDRIWSDRGCGGQTVVETMNGPLGSSSHVATALGPADTARDQLALEASDDTRSNMSGRTTIEDPSK